MIPHTMTRIGQGISLFPFSFPFPFSISLHSFSNPMTKFFHSLQNHKIPSISLPFLPRSHTSENISMTTSTSTPLNSPYPSKSFSSVSSPLSSQETHSDSLPSSPSPPDPPFSFLPPSFLSSTLSIPLLPSHIIHPLSSPSSFFSHLLSCISSPKYHYITLSSLYLGHKSQEKQLISAITNRMSADPHVKIHFILDFQRGMRGVGEKKLENSLSVISPIIERFNTEKQGGQRCIVTLFRPPIEYGSSSNSPFSYPLYVLLLDKLFRGRWRELRGVHHMKIYSFSSFPSPTFSSDYAKYQEIHNDGDIHGDCEMIISGANLSDTYFTNRMDRWMVIKHNSQIVHFYSQLFHILSQSKYSLNVTQRIEDGDYGWKSFEAPPENDIGESMRLRDKITTLLRPKKYSSEGTQNNNNDDDNDKDMNLMYLIPTIQMYGIHIRHEENLLVSLLKHIKYSSLSLPSPSPYSLHITSGYMNFPPWLSSLILTLPFPIHILSSSPQSNGWNDGQGIAKQIPNLYAAMERRLLGMAERPRKAGEERGEVSVSEWIKESNEEEKKDNIPSPWSFHAKGMWISKNNIPVVTLIGSSNFGHRSFYRDAETSILIVSNEGNTSHLKDNDSIESESKNRSKSEILSSERDHLWKHGVRVMGVEDFDGRKDRSVNGIIKWIAQKLKYYL